MSRVRTSSGHVLSVQSRLLGSALDGAHTAGATSLTVQDCADFDDDLGGSLVLNGTTYVYSDVDDDAGTLTISPALTADADDGDEATILDPILGSPQRTVTASVTEDGEDPGDPIEADVASGVVEQLPEGVRGLAGEAVTITWDEDDDPTLTAIAGLNADQAGFLRGYQDFATTAGAGDVSIYLTHQAIPDTTLQVKWNGIDLYDDEWTLSTDGWVITVADQGFKSGDRFMAKYDYIDPTVRPPMTAPFSITLHAGVVVDYGGTFGAGGGLTGSGRLWDDGSSATYLESIATPGVTIAQAQAPLDQLVLPTGAVVTSVTFNTRVEQTAGAYQTHVGVLVEDSGHDFSTQYGPTDPVGDSQGILIPSSGSIIDFATVAADFTDWPVNSLAALVALLEAPDTIIAARNVPDVTAGPTVLASTMRVYEMSVTVAGTVTV